jgi:hypothetical protein
MADDSARKKVSFDPTINLGHLLTFIGFICTGSLAYFDLRERISLGELKTQHIEQEFTQEKSRIRDALSEIKAGVAESNRKLDDVRDRQHSLQKAR